MSEVVLETSGVVTLVSDPFMINNVLNQMILNLETFQWSHPPLTGDIPPPCRAHTATLVDGKRIFIFGGGEGPTYYNRCALYCRLRPMLIALLPSLYVLDTQARKFTWVPCGQKPGTPPEGSASANGMSILMFFIRVHSSYFWIISRFDKRTERCTRVLHLDSI
jgi:hypothetical protein